ncbi:MAG: DNA-directed RNA polymerase subunit H [Candidatus Helarchaeota archaeon]
MEDNNIEFIPAKLVQMDILNHKFVPKHEIISKEEAVEMLIKYRLTKDVLPQISSRDPVAIVIGAKPGDFIKITRKSKTTGETIVYRYCVDLPED